MQQIQQERFEKALYSRVSEEMTKEQFCDLMDRVEREVSRI